jgi:hypothetical protein
MTTQRDPHSRLKRAIWSMDFTDRASLLTLSIIDKNRDEIGGLVLGLVELAARLSPHMSDDKRFRLADRCRDVADRIEHHQQEAPQGTQC